MIDLSFLPRVKRQATGFPFFLPSPGAFTLLFLRDFIRARPCGSVEGCVHLPDNCVATVKVSSILKCPVVALSSPVVREVIVASE